MLYLLSNFPLYAGNNLMAGLAVAVILRSAFSCFGATDEYDWPQYAENPFVIPLDIPAPRDSAGGIVVADLDGDTRMDFLVTVPGHIAAYSNDGRKLWTLDVNLCVGGSSEREGLPGHHGPGVQAGDTDGDGKTEALFLTKENALVAVNGADGVELWRAKPPWPDGAERWEHLVIANFRGKGDRDLLLQATNKDGYRVGRYLAAYAVRDLKSGKYEALWERDDFLACAHNGARVADITGNGRDEVLGGDIIDHKGALCYKIPLEGHIDAITAARVRPEIDGLQVIAVEEGGPQRVFLYNHESLVWATDHKNQEPQNVAVGDFDVNRPGKEIWNRSRYNEYQKPFVFDAYGTLIADYELAQVAPEGWTLSGVEVINTIHWTGEANQLAAAKERHEDGDVAVFDPLTGVFVEHFPETAARLYVADVSGDWREEILVISGNELHIYHNPAPNPRPDEPRLWREAHYRRLKMTWNYYSP